jgi:hypothetical protein
MIVVLLFAWIYALLLIKTKHVGLQQVSVKCMSYRIVPFEMELIFTICYEWNMSGLRVLRRRNGFGLSPYYSNAVEFLQILLIDQRSDEFRLEIRRKVNIQNFQNFHYFHSYGIDTRQ